MAAIGDGATVELVCGVLTVLTIVGSGIATLPWTDAEVRASVRAWASVGTVAGLAWGWMRAVRTMPSRVARPVRAALL